ncbi:thiol:disulfide interchange protein DsbA/DsbL [Duganella violaceipulchra]|uniref:Thiol:disulfide interchange protein n=1 Tax=Duganella violaceipulchra TaxID=2849652 RepID=A0AA41HAF8_9BURK|nr:thiol:disulfide interchange protein DsbA/DsbL [Duganella violaceicalia]MBV6322475.1 thiol:disulfide interchange protein DsbA/DsbL [Duganella violaceicalia]MCP2010680.1 thiol:disulfide interchange protein DsbA [Duganella violaceicalia]
MRFLLAAVTLAATVSGAWATEPKNGVDYLTLKAFAPSRAGIGAKVEVVEFFMYHCRHCYTLEPLLADWVKKQGDKISFRRVYLAGDPADPQAHAYVTLEAMGKLDAIHDKIFSAVQVERIPLGEDEALLEFVGRFGVDKAAYGEFFNSFAVQSRIRRAMELASTYKIRGAPSVVVDGRYMTSPSLTWGAGHSEAQAQHAMIAVLDALVVKAKSEDGRRAGPVAAAK